MKTQMPTLSTLALLQSVLASTQHIVELLAQLLLAAHPDLEPEPADVDPAARSLLYAAEALAFALARYRCEHDLEHRGDPIPFAPEPQS